MTEENKIEEEIPGSNPDSVEKPKKSKTKRQKEQPDEDETQDQEDLIEFAGTAIRQQRGGAFETLFSQLLASSVVVTDPLKRIKIVCEAAFMVREETRKDLKIDYERIEVSNCVANALLKPSIDNNQYFRVTVVSVPWPFSPSEENYKKFIVPWSTCEIYYWPILMRDHCKWHTTHYPPYKIVIDKIIREPRWSWFFDASQCLTQSGYDTMKNAFADWASRPVHLYLGELTEIVSRSLYNEILGLYTDHKKRGYAEKVKEISEAPSDEDNMDSGF